MDIISEIRVPVEIEIRKEDININKLDEKIYKASQAAGRKVFEESMKEINKYLLKANRNKEEVIIHSHKEGYLSTLVGEIRYRYTQVKDKSKKEGKYYSILKRAMGIGSHQQITDGVKVKGVMSASGVSYRKAAETLDNQISHSTIRKYTLKMGEELRKEEEENPGERIREAFFWSKGDQAFIEADGIMVPLQGGKHKWFEIKMAICYRGREDRYKESTTNQKKLKDKIVYGDICESEEFIEKASFFFNYFCNLMRVLNIVILGDGALWIKGFLSVYKWAVYQLDRFHLLEKIRKHFSRKKDEYEEIKLLIEENKIEEVMSKIKEKISFLMLKLLEYKTKMIEEKVEEEKERYKRGIKRTENKVARIQKLLTYIENNKEGINGIDKYKEIFSEEDLVIGSGGIENEVKNTIGRRMKGQGKCWKPTGATPMVKVLTSFSNGWYSFEDYVKIFSKNEKPLELPRKPKEKLIISKGKKETYKMEQIYKGNIPCFAPASSPTGYFKKGLDNIDICEVLHI